MTEPISRCCGAPVRVAGRSTLYWVCTQCAMSCDVVPDGPQWGVDTDTPSSGSSTRTPVSSPFAFNTDGNQAQPVPRAALH